MQTKRAIVVYHGIEFEIEYESKPISHSDAWKPCGDGTWVYNSDSNQLGRVSIGYSHELPYHYHFETWNPKGRFHKVVASSKPLWVWWGGGCMRLKWGDFGIALPQIKELCKNK